MFPLRISRLALSLSALLCTSVSAQRKPFFTSPLPTGVRLDPAGEAVDLGSLPINLIVPNENFVHADTDVIFPGEPRSSSSSRNCLRPVNANSRMRVCAREGTRFGE